MAERWTLNGYKGHNLFMVITHEIGHTLGLEHSPVRRALMSPYYKKLGKATVLSWDDINAVQQLYGMFSALNDNSADLLFCHSNQIIEINRTSTKWNFITATQCSLFFFSLMTILETKRCCYDYPALR